MADSCCRFSDLRTFCSNRNLRLISPSKHLFPSAVNHAHSSRVGKRKTSLPHLTLLSKPKLFSSNLDVVSTHEHSDGSLLFRFGVPTEIKKNAEIEKAQMQDEIKTKDEEGRHSVVKVFDGNREIEVVIKKVDNEISSSSSTGPADQAGTIPTAFSDRTSMESSDNIQPPVLVLGTENEVMSEVNSSMLDQSPEMETSAYVSSTHGAYTEHVEVKVEGMSEEAREDSSLDTENASTEMQSEIIENATGEASEEKDLKTGSLITENGSRVEFKNVAVANGNGSEMNESEVKFPEAEDGFVKEILENGSESCMIELKLDEDEAESAKRSDETTEAPVYELMELESTESATKREEILMTKFVLSSGAALLPHPSKALTGGEDAYFIAGQTWFGVADGVSQWSLEGTKPGVHAQELIKNCEKIVSGRYENSINDPLELLNRGVAETHSPGSSTVLVARFDGRTLNVANIGDSGFIVLRKGAVYMRSSPMQHAFCFPLLIGKGDDPFSLAETYTVDLEEDDLIITATDGLLDNLYEEEISSVVMHSLANGENLEEIAKLLATKAQERGGSSESTRSPFADDARATGFSEYTGGRLDDVAVIVSLVQRLS